ncbi:MAG TPA: M48 family metalloprotease, partial [Gemmatimonadales bacterium]|nr:M48 family metalloprotease [Gemmatimonadales bacterium]
MHPHTRATTRATLTLLALATSTGPATAQIPPHARWQTIATPHARITFAPGLDSLAREAGRHLEHAYARLASALGRTPDGPIDLLLTDHADIANAFAAPFPSNRIVILARPPLDDLGLAYHRDWLELVIAHELTHIFHLDRAGRWARAARKLLGRVPSAWPLFPAIATPQWAIEGLATSFESRLTGYGRARGTYHEMVLRTAALEGRFDRIDQASGYGPSWPSGQRWYAYGSLFLDHLAHTHGDDTP